MSPALNVLALGVLALLCVFVLICISQTIAELMVKVFRKDIDQMVDHASVYLHAQIDMARDKLWSDFDDLARLKGKKARSEEITKLEEEVGQLKEHLNIWRDGVEKGCSAETIQEQIRWKKEKSHDGVL